MIHNVGRGLVREADTYQRSVNERFWGVLVEVNISSYVAISVIGIQTTTKVLQGHNFWKPPAIRFSRTACRKTGNSSMMSAPYNQKVKDYSSKEIKHICEIIR